MRIAFISYEYPPDTASGGIGTYVYQAARMLRQRGHDVEVFAGSEVREGVFDEEDIRVRRIRLPARPAFQSRAGFAFAERHAGCAFDVLEGPEYGAEAAGAVQEVPDIPLVVKLHTPFFLVHELNRVRDSFYTSLRASLGATFRAMRRRGLLGRDDDHERRHVLDADEITSPSAPLADFISKEWQIPRSQIVDLPNPYVPSPDLIALPPLDGSKVVTFIGRLETRKGILDLGKAIPLVLKHMPDTKFRLIGRAAPSPDPTRDMRRYLEDFLRQYRSAVEFTGPVP